MITATEIAATKIKQQLEQRGKGLGIKVGVKTTGCSGLAYTLEFIDQIDQTYAIFDNYGTHIYVDPKHIPYLQGLEMDWVKKGLNEGFEFSNPQEKDRCGCGESFRI
jgi:iron-sulfur cluster assembly protein